MSRYSERGEVFVGKLVRDIVITVFTVSFIWGGFFTVPEGHVGIVKRFSEAKEQVGPGLNWKLPYMDSVEEMEVRTRKNFENNIPVATAEQMSSSAAISVNWTVVTPEAINVFRNYGGLEQFENRILDPRIRSGAKDAIAKYTAEEIIRNRNVVIGKIQSNITESMTGLPIVIDSIQLEDIAFPNTYTEAIEAKQVALQESIKEKHKLEKQRLVAQQQVNTAEAEKEAAMQRADGVAYQRVTEAKAEAEAITMVGEAEASKVKAITEALNANPEYVELVKAQQWDGQMPRWMTGDSANMLMSVGTKEIK